MFFVRILAVYIILIFLDHYLFLNSPNFLDVQMSDVETFLVNIFGKKEAGKFRLYDLKNLIHNS